MKVFFPVDENPKIKDLTDCQGSDENGDWLGHGTILLVDDEVSICRVGKAMPNMDGLEAFRELRLLNPDAKVILCSGYNEYEATQQFNGKNLAGFIHKPYELGRMKEILLQVFRL